MREWIASHAPLTSMTCVQAEPVVDADTLRYRATVGGAELWFSITLDLRREGRAVLC